MLEKKSPLPRLSLQAGNDQDVSQSLPAVQADRVFVLLQAF